MHARRIETASILTREEKKTCRISRRDLLKTLGAVTFVAAAPAGALWTGLAEAADPKYQVKPEKGAKLRVLRWKRFVPATRRCGLPNTKKFTEKTGIEVRVDSEGWEDVRPKAAVAANVGSGPDIIIGWFDDPHQYPDKLHDLTPLANYLGAKYGGWYDVLPTLRYPRREVDCPAPGHHRQSAGLSGKLRQSRRLRRRAEGSQRFPETVQGVEGEGHAGRPGAWATPSATATMGALGGLDPRRQDGGREGQRRHQLAGNRCRPRICARAVSDLCARYPVLAGPA